MPIVMQRWGTTSILPPTVFALIVRVSRESDSTRVGSAANASVLMVSPGSGGSLKAMCPLIPIPPKQASTPPRSADQPANRVRISRIWEHPLFRWRREFFIQQVEKLPIHESSETERMIDG